MPDTDPSYRELLAFLYRTPVAMVQLATSGKVEMMTPRAAALLLSLSPGSDLQDLFAVLDPVAPQIRRAVEAFPATHGVICEALRLEEGRAGLEARVLSVSVLKTSADELIVTLEDVTEETRRIEREQRHSRHRLAEVSSDLEHALEMAGVLVAREDLATGSVLANRRLRERLGLGAPSAALTASRLRGCVHPDDRAAYDEDRREARAGLTTSFRDFRFICADGAVGWIAGRRHLACDVEGRAAALITFAIDVTRQRAVEAERLTLAEHLDLATTAAGVGTFELPADDAPWHWSAQTYALHGRPAAAGEDPRAVFDAAVAPQDRVRVEAWWRSARADGSMDDLEYRVRWPDGSFHWLGSRGRARLEADGRLRSVVGVVWDVTAQRRARAALEAQRLAEQASRAKSEFVARMSHELRTPLNAILGFSELLLVDGEHVLAPKQREQLGLIHGAGRHMLQLVSDFLDLSRIESGSLPVTLVGVDALALTRGVLQELATDADARKVRLALAEPDGRPVTVRADPRRLKQVLLNLVSNAVKYNRPGGSVTVRMARHGRVWRLNVVDTGLGMTVAQQTRLFRPFERLGRAASGIEGVGIGLLITRQLVKAMGGELRVSSVRDVGSDFEVELAADAAAAGSGAAPAAPAAAPRVDAEVAGRLLCVEDDAASQAILRSYLAWRPGIAFEMTATGAACIAQAQRSYPDLLLADQQLPDMLGLDVVRAVRRLRPGRPARCILISAGAMAQEIEAATAAGVDAYLPKPLQADPVLAEVDRLIRPADEDEDGTAR